MIVRGWWLCRSFESDSQIAPKKAKLTSMLMLAHLIATSGSLFKTGVIFAMNPLAFNWAADAGTPTRHAGLDKRNPEAKPLHTKQVGRGVDKHISDHAGIS